MRNFSFVNLINVTILGTSASGFLCLSLLDASIKSLVLLGFSTIVCLILVRASAAARHLVWATTMLGLLLMPACALGLPQWRVLPSWLSLENRVVLLPMTNQPVAVNEPASHVYSESQPTLPHEGMAEVGEFARPIEPPPVVATKEFVRIPIRLSAVLLLGIWGAGCAACLIPTILAFLRLQQIENAFVNKSALPPRIVERITQLTNQMAMKIPRIIVGPPGAMPMVWSFGRSRLFLPADIESWSPMRLNAVLLHELVHLKRRDTTWFLVAQLARAVNWFNPLAWYAVQRLRVECECACDDHVLRMGVDASEYAGHLLALSTCVRTASGTTSLALAMANKPNVENRIISILDERMNRHGVTFRRTMVTLGVVSIGVAILATLAATAADKDHEIAKEEQEEEVPRKYPYCVLVVDNLQPRSLAEALSAFNKESQESPTGVFQLPLSEHETLAAILKFVELEHVPESTKASLREIANSKTLPANAYLRRFTRFDDEQQMQGVWWVRLYIEGSTPPVYSVPIRTVSIFARPYTQPERKQKVEGMTLINRFTSYFEEPPIIRLKEEFPQVAVDRLKNAFRKAIYVKDLDSAKKLYHWQGVSDSTRDFATSELQMLFEASALSIKIEPRTLNGNLIHWSAYQHYEPNLPVAGYMQIEYTPHDPSTIAQKPTGPYLLDNGDILGVYVEGVLPYKPVSGAPANNSFPDGGNSVADPPLGFPIVVQENGTIALPSIGPISAKGLSVEQVTDLIKKTYLDAKVFTEPAKLRPIVTIIKKRMSFPKKVLSLEFGKVGNEFRLVNYVAVGERKLPEGILQGLSIRGNMEPLADGTSLMSSVITNPGSLISAHLANEEILQRGSTDDSLGRAKSEDEKQRLQPREDSQYVQGKIVEVQDGHVYINLGKADGLRKGVRFGVVDLDVTIVANARPKAQIEVVEVISSTEHLSRCKVVSDKGANRIINGDGIYAPTWRPGKKVEFALIGKMDIDGDGNDDREAVKALIAQNGGQVTEELTVDTRWLVVGQDANETDEGGLFQSEAKQLGISRINLDKLMGWLRGNVNAQKSSPNAKGSLNPRFNPNARTLALRVQERAAAINALPRFFYKATHSSGIVATVKPSELKTAETIEAYRNALTKPFSIRYYSHQATIAFDDQRSLYATEIADHLCCLSVDRHEFWELNSSRYESPNLVRHNLDDNKLQQLRLSEFAYLVQTPRKFWWGELVNANPNVSQIDPKKVTWNLLDPQEFAGELCDAIESPQRGERLWIGRTSGHLRGIMSFENEAYPDWPSGFENNDSAHRIAGRGFASRAEYLDWFATKATSDQKKELWRATQEFATTGYSGNTLLYQLIQFDDYRQVKPGIWIPFHETSSTTMDIGRTNQGLPSRRTYPERNDLSQYFSKAELIVDEVRFDVDVDARWEMLKLQPR